MSVATYTQTGTKAATAAKLDKAIFGVALKNHDLLKSAYLAYLANGRKNLAITKTRGLISGGGRKPWRQKGTGRARFGSSRNPIWRGGGIAFGPTGQENYTQKLSTSQKRQAISQALTLAARDDKITVIETLSVKDGKTNTLGALLLKVGIVQDALIIVEHKTDELLRAARNLPNIKIVQAQYTNVFDVMNANQVLITTEALKVVQQRLSAAGSKAS